MAKAGVVYNPQLLPYITRIQRAAGNPNLASLITQRVALGCIRVELTNTNRLNVEFYLGQMPGAQVQRMKMRELLRSLPLILIYYTIIGTNRL